MRANTQLYLQQELNLTAVVDPWGGSYYVEYLTNALVERARELMAEVESLGGMAKAIEQGVPKMRIEEAAARKQARIDAGKEVIGGRESLPHPTKSLTTLGYAPIDTQQVRETQLASLTQVKKSRNPQRVSEALRNLTQAATHQSGNLLELAVIAARERATLGEISLALEAGLRSAIKLPCAPSPEYNAQEVDQDQDFQQARALANRFAEWDGRRPRILVAKMGQDGHDRGAKVIATSFADLGFDVDIGPLFQTPEEVARQAAENDVHVIGISSLAGGAHRPGARTDPKSQADQARRYRGDCGGGDSAG